jgi:hypothetical protein
MKSLALLFFFSLSLWSANIDTKLYEGNNTIAYYGQISKLIDQEGNQDQADIERITTERMILAKLKDMSSITSEIHPLPDVLLTSDQNISTANYLSYLNALSNTYATIDILKEEQSIMQSKRKYLSQSINDITAEDKKNLLLYQLQYAFYKLKGKNHALSIKTYETLVEKGEAHFNQALKRVIFDIPSLKKNMTDTETKFPGIEQEAVALNLAKERELIHHENISKVLSDKILVNTMERMAALTTKIDQTILLSLAYLQKGETHSNVIF